MPVSKDIQQINNAMFAPISQPVFPALSVCPHYSFQPLSSASVLKMPSCAHTLASALPAACPSHLA